MAHLVNRFTDMYRTSLVLVLVLVGSAACSGNKKGVCVTRTNCFLNQQESNCNDAADKVKVKEEFVPVKGLDEAMMLCKSWGYAFRDERDEREQRDKYKRGALADMEWTIELMNSQIAARICGSAPGSGACVPWEPPPMPK